MRTRVKAVLITSVKRVERNTTRKRVNNPASRSELRIKGIKRRKDFVKPVIHVNNQAFNQLILAFCKKFE